MLEFGCFCSRRRPAVHAVALQARSACIRVLGSARMQAALELFLY
jgi:hypothetical protein